MDLTKKTVHYTQEGKTVFDRFYLDEDYNVPCLLYTSPSPRDCS